jgi:hypothetical protein
MTDVQQFHRATIDLELSRAILAVPRAAREADDVVFNVLGVHGDGTVDVAAVLGFHMTRYDRLYLDTGSQTPC